MQINMIYAISILAILGLVLIKKSTDKSKELESQGVIKDTWDRYNTIILSLGAIILGWLGFEASQGELILSELKNIVLMIDAVIGSAMVLFSMLKAKKVLAVCVLLMATNMGFSQETWIKSEDGKFYKVGLTTHKVDKWDAMYNEYTTSRGSIEINGIIDRINDVFEFIKKHRFTEQERNIYNFGVSQLNEVAGGQVILKID